MGNSILVGIGVFIVGFFLSALCCIGSLEDYNFYNAIIISILYLAGVVAVCASLILKEMKNKNNE